MTAHGLLAALHVAAGAAGLLLGPVVMRAPKQRGQHTRLGAAYLGVVTVVCVSAALLSVLQWSTRWWFLPIAIGTLAAAVLGYWAGRRGGKAWLLVHVAGQISSYTGMATAFVVNNWEALTGNPGVSSPLAFLLPMSIGTGAVLWLLREVAGGRRPRYTRNVG